MAASRDLRCNIQSKMNLLLISRSPVVELVLQEILLPFLQQLTLGVRSTVAKKLFRITVTGLREKAGLLKFNQLKESADVQQL